MSRSYKKHPYCTDGRSPTTKEMKAIANRTVRRRNKSIVQGYFYEDPKYMDEPTLDGMSYKRYFCSYDIHDYVSRWSRAEAIYDYEHPHWVYYAWCDEWWHIWIEYETVEKFLQYWAKHYRRK